MNDLVSVIMPSYNTDKFIKQSIESVIDQTYKNWELIIVDDCSTDNTDNVVASISDERIVYLKNKVNSGAAMSRNRALREAKGRWIAFLDSDDLWSPDKLEKQIKFMEDNDYHFSYTNYKEINEDGKLTGVMVTGPKKITKTGMYNYCWPGCLTVMYDAQVVGLIQIEDIKKNNDYAMWLKVCKKVNCYLLDEVLAGYRRGRSGSISTHSVFSMFKWHYKLFRFAEEKGIAESIFYVVKNLIFGSYKKTIYVKKLKKLFLIGNLGGEKNSSNGQTIKTKVIYNALENKIGKEDIRIINTYGGIKNILKVPFQCWNSLQFGENIIIMLAENGLCVYAPLLAFLNKFFNKKLYYVVIGGWLPDFLENRHKLIQSLKNFSNIYVETKIMKNRLNEMGLNNVKIMPNCKNLNILKANELIYTKSAPFKICTFSRVMKEKGIEDAIKAVIEVNNLLGKNAFYLEIYGQIEETQKEWFNMLQTKLPKYIRYRGIIQYDKTTEVLKNYVAVVFPTYYPGEGFAGTLIDSLAAGVPVIASDWKYNSEIIISGWNGDIIKTHDYKALANKLINIYNNIDDWNSMKLNAITQASKYLPDVALEDLYNQIGISNEKYNISISNFH